MTYEDGRRKVKVGSLQWHRAAGAVGRQTAYCQLLLPTFICGNAEYPNSGILFALQ